MLRVASLLLFVAVLGCMGQFDDLQSTLLKFHNDARGNPFITPKGGHTIPPLNWSSNLANISTNWSQQCRYHHSYRHASTLRGELLYYGNTPLNYTEAFNSWFGTGDYYDWILKQCHFGDCRTFAQIMWNRTFEFGCGATECGNGKTLLVCTYNKFGQYRGVLPYQPDDSNWTNQTQYHDRVKAQARNASYPAWNPLTKRDKVPVNVQQSVNEQGHLITFPIIHYENEAPHNFEAVGTEAWAKSSLTAHHKRSVADALDNSNNIMYHSDINQGGNTFTFQGFTVGSCIQTSSWSGIANSVSSIKFTTAQGTQVTKIRVFSSGDCSGTSGDFTPDSNQQVNYFGSYNDRVNSLIMVNDAGWAAFVAVFQDINFGGAQSRVWLTRGNDCYTLSGTSVGQGTSSLWLQPGRGFSGITAYTQDNCGGSGSNVNGQHVSWIGTQLNDRVLSFRLIQGGDDASIDWRNFPNIVTPVKNQGSCGDCWAFSATEAVETAYAMALGWTYLLSPQQTTSCSGAGSCNGGWPATALQYFCRTGIATESSYPFQSGADGQTRSCSYNNQPAFGRNPALKTWGSVPQNFQSYLAALKNYGPLSITVQVGNGWSGYSGGVIRQSNSGNINHAILLVGYDAGRNAWLVKNQWDTWWGEGGYAWLDVNAPSDIYTMAPVWGQANL